MAWRRPDQRSEEAREYRYLYKTAAWRSIREHQLAKHPLCQMCEAAGRITDATVCDHVEPHRGDPAKFFAGPFQSLCDESPWRCHSKAKQLQERAAEQPFGSDIDGRPTDPLHPWNGGPALSEPRRFSIPRGLEPSAIPVTLVCGPPASGKSTFARERASTGDTIIDFNDVLVRVGGEAGDTRAQFVRKAFAYRDKMILGLKDKRRGRAWLIVGAPTLTERAAWCESLGNTNVALMEATEAECLARISADPQRRSAAPRLTDAIHKWFAQASTEAKDPVCKSSPSA